MKNKNYSTPQYQLFCRIVCPGLIFLGLILLAVSYRTSQLTCQRSTGMCTISHPGTLAAPEITIRLDDVDRVYAERTDGCCTSDTPIKHNLTIQTGEQNPLNRLLYSWVNWDAAKARLESAANQINQFMADPTIPEVTIRLPDHRHEDLFCGLYFLFAGLIYTIINFRVIFSRQQAVNSTRASLNSGQVMMVEHPAKKERFRNLFPIWLWWSLVPTLFMILFSLAYDQFFSALTSFSRTAASFAGNMDFYNVEIGLSRMMMVFASMLLAFIIAKVWKTDRKDPRGFPSTAARLTSTGLLVFLVFGFFLIFDDFFWGQSTFFALLVFLAAQAWAVNRLGMNGYGWIAATIAGGVIGFVIMLWGIFWYLDQYYWYQAESQGWLSISGLVLGSLISIFQLFVLRQRAAHASWWILGTAMVCEAFFVTPKLAVALFPQLQTWWEMVTNQINIGLISAYLPAFVILIIFSAIQGAILLWMVKSDPVEITNGTLTTLTE